MFKRLLLALLLLSTSTICVAKSSIVTLSPANTIIFRDMVDADSVSRAVLKLSTNHSDTVYFYIYSPGGNIVDGFRLIDTIKVLAATGKNIVCIADYAASMAFSILQACPKRLALENAVIMQHQAATTMQGQLSRIQSDMKLTESLVNKLHSGDATRLGLTLEQFRAKIDNDWWMFDTEIVDNKAADGMVLVKCDNALALATYKDVYRSILGDVIVTWSSCPLTYTPVAVDLHPTPGINIEMFLHWMSTLPIDGTWKERKAFR